ncbi:hypothetical protein [Photobacterium halotolerans]|uniref:hypothetical protein n=1 Tax=Photobacterium halotolerans TaxID=265726 RepID=UPI001F27B487|nr:hypothetical protein [Photobacterium halotolerans]
MNGKQVRIKRSPTVDGMTVEQFVEENADLIFLHQNELWELMPVEDALSGSEPSRNYKGSHPKEQPAAVAGRVSAAFLLQRESIGKISHLLSRHILPTRQFLYEKSRLKDGPNLLECLQKLRRQFEQHQDHHRATAMLRYEISFNSFHNQISKVSHSVDQFLARSKKRLKQFNAIEAAFGELAEALDATRYNLKRSLIDGEFARNNGAFMGLMQQARPKVLRISSSEAYLNNVVSDIEARVADQSLLSHNRYVALTSSKDDSTERRLARAEQICNLVKQMQMAEYQDLTLALHRRLKTQLAEYHFVDLLEGLSSVLRSEDILDEHAVRVTNFRNRLLHDDTVYLYRKIRTERVK